MLEPQRYSYCNVQEQKKAEERKKNCRNSFDISQKFVTLHRSFEEEHTDWDMV